MPGLIFCIFCLCVVLSTVVMAGFLQNARVKIFFGARGNENKWGDYGDVFGEARQVIAGRENYVKSCRLTDTGPS